MPNQAIAIFIVVITTQSVSQYTMAPNRQRILGYYTPPFPVSNNLNYTVSTKTDCQL
jgi:hypothetical protein